MDAPGGSWAIFNERKAERERAGACFGACKQPQYTQEPWADKWSSKCKDPLESLLNLPTECKVPANEFNLGPLNLNPDTILQDFAHTIREFVKWEIDPEFLEWRRDC